MAMGKVIWVYIETNEDGVSDVSLQSLAKASEIAALTGTEVDALLLGRGVQRFSDDLIKLGAARVYVADDPRLEQYATTGYKKVVCALAREYMPDVLLLPASTQGNDLAPAVAANLQTGCVMDCQQMTIEEGILLQTRLEFDSKVFTSFVTQDRSPQIATLKDGIAEIGSADSSRQGEVVAVDVVLDETDLVTKILKREIAAKTVNLKSARIIVAGGAGVGNEENFRLIERLAETLGGEVGASRPAVDAGWTSAERQIGQTGTTVKPDLYIACGISGAVQHRVGMMNSGKIIAINTDPSAPIFRFAHYRIVGDLTRVIPRLIEFYKEG